LHAVAKSAAIGHARLLAATSTLESPALREAI
jgi:hypothetical protein